MFVQSLFYTSRNYLYYIICIFNTDVAFLEHYLMTRNHGRKSEKRQLKRRYKRDKFWSWYCFRSRPTQGMKSDLYWIKFNLNFRFITFFYLCGYRESIVYLTRRKNRYTVLFKIFPINKCIPTIQAYIRRIYIYSSDIF